MNQALRQKVIVQPGGIIQICSPELPPGSIADVIIILETTQKNRPSLTSFIGTAKGSFNTVEEVDNFINRERDNWSS